MSFQALVSSDLPSFLIYDTINASATTNPLMNINEVSSSSATAYYYDNAVACNALSSLGLGRSLTEMLGAFVAEQNAEAKPVEQAKRKRRRKSRTCKNKEEAETQRMTHIAVERNRRRLMNEHLAVLRSLMPESYVQRGDQASIVGGAIDFVKELEQHLQSLEAKKRKLQAKAEDKTPGSEAGSSCSSSSNSDIAADSPPFAQFFTYPQYSMHSAQRDYVAAENRSAVADIEVSLIETHANLRILSPKRPRQLVKMVAGLQSLRLSVLHLNVTSLDSMVLYSLSVKLEEGCNLTSVDEIATAVHHILTLIEADRAVHGQ